MKSEINRKDFLRLAGLGGVVFASSLGRWGGPWPLDRTSSSFR